MSGSEKAADAAVAAISMPSGTAMIAEARKATQTRARLMPMSAA